MRSSLRLGLMDQAEIYTRIVYTVFVACLGERGHYQAPIYIAVVALVVSEMPVDT